MNITALRQVWNGAAPKSARSIYANLANRFAMACAGARHAQKYITALTSGGLSAKPRGA
ncbi:MAG: hypothetical protein AAF988_01395 [Pseudomonadota bacterium]